MVAPQTTTKKTSETIAARVSRPLFLVPPASVPLPAYWPDGEDFERGKDAEGVKGHFDTPD
jgi:hypothetical protein